MIEILTILLSGIVVGLSLGLTGGGGSNLAVPLLVYAVGLPPAQAIPVSLAAVALVAAVGALHAIRRRMIAWQPALTFALGGMCGTPVGLYLAHGVEPRMLMIGFALLALSVGSAMWYRARRHPGEAAVVRALPEGDTRGPVCRMAADGQLRFSAPCSVVLVLAGLATGLLSGFFGVGGGFLIVPALMAITGMGINGAVAVSLVVIAMTGFTGAAYAVWQERVVWSALLPFALGGAAGMLLGRRIAMRIAGPALQQIFAALIMAIAVAVLLCNLL